MAISFVFDGAAKTIQITALATDYVNNSLTFSAQNIYSAWKDWCINGDGLQYPPAFDTLGGDPIDAVTSVGDYYFMRTDLGWRGLPPAQDNTILVLQGNLYPRVPGDLVMEPLPAFTTTLIMQTSSLTQTVITGGTTVSGGLTTQEHDKLLSLDTAKLGYISGEVYCDTNLAVNGDGTQGSPFNNINDAKSYAELNNIRDIILTGNVVMPSSMNNITIKGVGLPIIDLNGQDANGSKFTQCQLKGTYTNSIIAQECVLLNGLTLNGFFDRCALDGDLVCPDLSKTLMSDCKSNIPGLARPTISMSGVASKELGARGYHGGLTISNCTNVGNNVTVEMAEGSLTFDSTNVAGTMIARGLCKFVDESAGATVVDETIAQGTFDQLSSDIAKVVYGANLL